MRKGLALSIDPLLVKSRTRIVKIELDDIDVCSSDADPTQEESKMESLNLTTDQSLNPYNSKMDHLTLEHHSKLGDSKFD